MEEDARIAAEQAADDETAAEVELEGRVRMLTDRCRKLQVSCRG